MLRYKRLAPTFFTHLFVYIPLIPLFYRRLQHSSTAGQLSYLSHLRNVQDVGNCTQSYGQYNENRQNIYSSLISVILCQRKWICRHVSFCSGGCLLAANRKQASWCSRYSDATRYSPPLNRQTLLPTCFLRSTRNLKPSRKRRSRRLA